MINVEDVNYVYQPGTPFEKQALSDINLEIPNGSITAIIGRTGSGKSTLVQLFNALIRPTSGRITINGTDITAKNADLRAMRFKVGLVFQYPEYQLFEETVFADVAFGPKNMGLSGEETERRVKNAMKLAGLDVPQITQLAEKLRILGYPLPPDIYTVESAAAALKKLIGGGKHA